MNYLGVYHSDYSRPTATVCDAPCVSKGRMLLCAPEIASEGQLIAMAFGRIRNRRQLAYELKCPVNTAGSYIVLLAYRKWGIEYVNRLEGPVVTCVMDTACDRMILSRDRMGEQPVFYTLGSNNRVVFSDHPDSLLKSATAEPVVDREGLCELFGMGPARTPGRTPLRDVKMLEAGFFMHCEVDRRECSEYFRIRQRRHEENSTETIAHVRQLLDDAVEWIAPLKPGVMLSGGLDSTALTAMLCTGSPNIHTFSVDYADNSKDFRPNAFRPEMDSPYVDQAVQVFGTKHQTFVLEQAALADALEAAVSARGFPGMADVDSSMLLFAGKIAPNISTVVSGECGDEVFGGYPWFRGDGIITGESFPWSGSMQLRKSVLKKKIDQKIDVCGYVNDRLNEAIDHTQIDRHRTDRESNLKRMQLMCLRYFMPNLQERALRMCGYHHLEVLTPLCDDRLVEYVFNIPWDMKFMNGIEKGIFRAAVRDIMPVGLNQRKKSPYPKTCSPIYTEIVRGLTAAMLTDRDAPILELIDKDYVLAIARSDLDPTATPWFGQLMAGPQMLAYLWQINTWMRDRNITVSL